MSLSRGLCRAATTAGSSLRSAGSLAHGVTADVRRARLKEMLTKKELVTAIECHSGLTGLIVEAARGAGGQKFSATWSSSLTSSTTMGKPDIETISTTDRLEICQQVLEVTTLPMIYDGDTGGLA